MFKIYSNFKSSPSINGNIYLVLISFIIEFLIIRFPEELFVENNIIFLFSMIKFSTPEI